MMEYGLSVKGIFLEFGWCKRFIATLCAIGVVLSILTTVLTTLVTHDLNCGWSAGCYTAAVVTIGLALFASLSAII